MLRSRIAPTPSGYLHIGNAINFVLAWLHARKEKGSLRLRIDDLDAPRVDPGFIDDIFRTLEWLGLDWDEGPQTAGEHYKLFSQQSRIERYNELIGKLRTTGRVFACSCSRKEIQEMSSDGRYPGICRDKGLSCDSHDHALRIMVPSTTSITVHDIYTGDAGVKLYDVMRDFVIRRRDGIPAYHIASLADDEDHNINFIVRGYDLLESTAAQLYLAQLLEMQSFIQTRFYHHPLVKDEKGEKLSKSAGSASLKAWREKGTQTEEFCLMLCRMLGWKEQATSLNEMLELARAGLPLQLQV